MKEIELKAKVRDVQALEQYLQEAGCVWSAPITQEDKVYLPNGMTYEDSFLGVSVLRVRVQDDSIRMTLKQSQSNDLDCIEHEVVVDNAEEASALITMMDYYQGVDVKKARRTSTLGSYNLCLDHVDHLGTFIEVEHVCEDGDAIAIQQEMATLLTTFGIREEDHVCKGYDQLMYAFLKQKEQ